MLDLLETSVQKGRDLGANFVEARFEDLTLRTLQRTDDTWKDIQVKSRMGVAITCYVKGVAGFSFTASIEKEAILETTERALRMAHASEKFAKLRLPFPEQEPVVAVSPKGPKIGIHPRERDFEFKTRLVNRAVETAREHGKNVRNVLGMYGELYGRKIIVNSDSSKIDWEFLVTDLRVRITSKNDSGALVLGMSGSGGTWGLDHFGEKDNTPEKLGERAAKKAVEQIQAKPCPAGKFRALIENQLAGVLAHESFGHLSEADFVVTGGSPLTGKIGAQLGSEHATIIDSGIVDTEKFGGLWVPYDDQGMPASKTIVLDHGVLNHYLHNRGTAAKLDEEPTGNARAVNFAFPPIVRMTNTYFAPGTLTEEEALELVGTGVYAIETAGGQVQDDGSFLFKAMRGYWVENGEKKYPIREVSLSGNILNLLGEIEGATKELKLYSGYFGGCGKGGQSPLPVGLGGPMLVINNVTFGGKT